MNDYYIITNDIKWMRKSNPDLGEIIIPYITGFIEGNVLTVLDEKSADRFLRDVKNNNLHYVDGVSFQDIDSFVLGEIGNEIVQYASGLQEICEDIAEIEGIEFKTILKI